ncbi:hypothetical protein KsCSTR_17790 [Candidatus Kuenenia stuttgartiensis]|nr:hypothetical protein KsCSTR_17790 [Candidatus Kuenenia stuttgartiensis]
MISIWSKIKAIGWLMLAQFHVLFTLLKKLNNRNALVFLKILIIALFTA